MVTAKCTRCGGAAIGSTFTEASAKINHAVGLSRGIKCGDNWNKVVEVNDNTKDDTKVKIKDVKPPKTIEIHESNYKSKTLKSQEKSKSTD